MRMINVDNKKCEVIRTECIEYGSCADYRITYMGRV